MSSEEQQPLRIPAVEGPSQPPPSPAIREPGWTTAAGPDAIQEDRVQALVGYLDDHYPLPSPSYGMGPGRLVQRTLPVPLAGSQTAGAQERAQAEQERAIREQPGQASRQLAGQATHPRGASRGRLYWGTLLLAAAYLGWWAWAFVAPVASFVARWARDYLQPASAALAAALLLSHCLGAAQRLAGYLAGIATRQWRPATDGDPGRERSDAAATRLQPGLTGEGIQQPGVADNQRTQVSPDTRAILDALLELRDTQLAARESQLTAADLQAALAHAASFSGQRITTPASQHPPLPPLQSQQAPPQPGRIEARRHARPGSSAPQPRILQPEFQGSRPRTLSPMVSRSARELPDGRWELGADIHAAMVKSAPTMIVRLKGNASYEQLKAWLSAVDDWVFSHTSVYPDSLGPAAVRSVARMTLEAELYAALEGEGAFGQRDGRGQAKGDTTWDVMMDFLRDRLGCSSYNLKLGLAFLRQETRSMKDFAREFDRRAKDAGISEEDAKVLLVGSLNQETLQRLDTYVTTRGGDEVASRATIQERLRLVSYQAMLNFLKQSNLSDLAT